MVLSAGTRLGPYEIVSALGAGGMGEVYRAHDTRLDRSVAIKVLPETLAADPQFRERFEREARAISQLTHPHICTLHDVGRQGLTDFLVMEFLEGETLADRLTKGALPLDQALTLAIQIASALDAAHRAGIVHRDLKPGNIMLTKAGAGRPGSPQAKLLDFGLAKANAPALGGAGLSMLPTTPPGLTAQGTILGTFQYMAPEQLEGQEADARTDIFAFGCVLYEMLTGQKAFVGKTQASLVAAILEREPMPVTTVQPLVPRFVDSVVLKCLAKKADDRWQSVADLGSALRWAAEGTATGAAAVNTGAGTHRAGSRHAALVGTIAAIALIMLAAGALGSRYISDAPARAASVRFEILPPPDAAWTPSPVASAAQLVLSPDGRRLAFVAARKGGTSQLWVRPLDRVQAQPLPGTEGASFPFWSPEGRFLGFFASGKLKTIDTTGGGPQTLCDAVNGRGGSWSPGGVIVFAGNPNGGIARISAAGGPVTAVTTLEAAQKLLGHNWPHFLPDGRHFLFYQRSGLAEYQGVYVASLDSSTVTPVLPSGSMAAYASGHLLFARDGILFAQPFDDRAFRTTGEPIRIADHVGYFSGAFGYIAATASSTGVLVHGPGVALTTSLRWLDRSGASAGRSTSPGIYSSPRLSPDQKSVAVAITDAATPERDIWVMDVPRGTTSRATFDPAADWFPTWGPDGVRMFFGSSRAGATAIFHKTGAGQDELFSSDGIDRRLATYPNDISNDGRFLVYTQTSPKGYDLGVFPLVGERTPSTYLATPFNEAQGRFSPNTRWIAYASDESGRFEVYVRPFPARDEQWKVSVAGGTQPEWRRDGKELFYISAERQLMAVPVTTDGGTFSAGVPHTLFDVELPEVSAPYPTDYAVSADGQRFLVNTVIEQVSRPALTVVLNWTSELEK